jgi:hypothetical protein
VVSTANDDVAWQDEYVRALEGNPCPDISFEDKACNHSCRIWIPDDLQWKKLIWEVEHRSKVAGYMGLDKAIKLVR